MRNRVSPKSVSADQEVRICNLRVGGATVDLLLQRHAQHVGLNVLRQTGSAEIVVLV
jgi:hypothetical protein